MAILNIPENNQVHTKKASVGTTVTITARGKHGYEFDHWEDLRAGDAGYTSATRNYVVKPSGNDLVAKFKNKNLGGITPVASQGYTLNGNNIDVNAPKTVGDYTVSFKFDGNKEWAHNVVVNGLNTNEYEITTHNQYEVVVKVIGDAIRKLGNANVVFTDRFNNTTTANYKAYSPTMYTINATISGATGTITQSHTGSVEKGTRVVFNAPEVNGKKFMGWFVNGSSVGEGRELSYVIRKNTDFIARYSHYSHEYSLYEPDITGTDNIFISQSIYDVDGHPNYRELSTIDDRNVPVTYGLKNIDYRTAHTENAYEYIKSVNTFESFGTSYNDFPQNSDRYVLAVRLYKVTIDTDAFNEFITNNRIVDNTDKYHRHWIVSEGNKTIIYSTGYMHIDSQNSSNEFGERMGIIIHLDTSNLEVSNNGTEWNSIGFGDITNKFIRKKAAQYATVDPGPYALEKRKYIVGQESMYMQYGDISGTNFDVNDGTFLKPVAGGVQLTKFSDDGNDMTVTRQPAENSFEFNNNGVWELAGDKVALTSRHGVTRVEFKEPGSYRILDAVEVNKPKQSKNAVAINTNRGVLLSLLELRKIVGGDVNYIEYGTRPKGSYSFLTGSLTRIDVEGHENGRDSVLITNSPAYIYVYGPTGSKLLRMFYTSNDKIRDVNPGFYIRRIEGGNDNTYDVNMIMDSIGYEAPHGLSISLVKLSSDSDGSGENEYIYQGDDTFHQSTGFIGGKHPDVIIHSGAGYGRFIIPGDSINGIYRSSGFNIPSGEEQAARSISTEYMNASSLIGDVLQGWPGGGNSPITINNRTEHENTYDVPLTYPRGGEWDGPDREHRNGLIS